MKRDPLLDLTPIAATSVADVSRRLAAMRSSTAELDPVEAWSAFSLLQDDFEEMAGPLRRRLLETPLAWTDEEKESARWIHRCSNDFSVIGHRFSEAFVRQLGIEAERTRRITAQTLYFMGETVKWEVAVTPEPRHDFGKPNGLMRAAMASGQHRGAITLRYDGRDAPCTIESLYFRMGLLARFASGTLNCKQIEILDAWMWLWMPTLSGVSTPPPGNALRADLDTNDALRHGPRGGEGISLYLPQEPIERAYRLLVAEFQAGRIVPPWASLRVSASRSTWRSSTSCAVPCATRGAPPSPGPSATSATRPPRCWWGSPRSPRAPGPWPRPPRHP